MMPVLFRVTLRYEMTCAACGKKHEQVTSALQGAVLHLPSAPVNWHIVDGLLFCDAHQIVIRTKKEVDVVI